MTTKNDVLIAMTNMVDVLTSYVEGINKPTEIDEDKVKEIIGEMEFSSANDVESMIEDALNDYDPADHIDFSDAINDALDSSHAFERMVKDAVNNLSFEISVS